MPTEEALAGLSLLGTREQILANATLIYHLLPNSNLLTGNVTAAAPPTDDAESITFEIGVAGYERDYAAVLFQVAPSLSILARSQIKRTYALAALDLLEVMSKKLHENFKHLETALTAAEANSSSGSSTPRSKDSVGKK